MTRHGRGAGVPGTIRKKPLQAGKFVGILPASFVRSTAELFVYRGSV